MPSGQKFLLYVLYDLKEFTHLTEILFLISLEKMKCFQKRSLPKTEDSLNPKTQRQCWYKTEQIR